MAIAKIGLECVDWINLVPYWYRWLAVISALMSRRGPQNVCNFFTIRVYYQPLKRESVLELLRREENYFKSHRLLWWREETGIKLSITLVTITVMTMIVGTRKVHYTHKQQTLHAFRWSTRIADEAQGIMGIPHSWCKFCVSSWHLTLSYLFSAWFNWPYLATGHYFNKLNFVWMALLAKWNQNNRRNDLSIRLTTTMHIV